MIQVVQPWLSHTWGLGIPSCSVQEMLGLEMAMHSHGLP